MNKSSYMYIIQKKTLTTPMQKLITPSCCINYTIVQPKRNYNGTLKNIEQNRVNKKVEHST